MLGFNYKIVVKETYYLVVFTLSKCNANDNENTSKIYTKFNDDIDEYIV